MIVCWREGGQEKVRDMYVVLCVCVSNKGRINIVHTYMYMHNIWFKGRSWLNEGNDNRHLDRQTDRQTETDRQTGS